MAAANDNAALCWLLLMAARRDAAAAATGRRVSPGLGVAPIDRAYSAGEWSLPAPPHSFTADSDYVDAQDVDGWTPLHVAIFWGASRAAAVLLAHGASLLKTNSDNDTALDLAESDSKLSLALQRVFRQRGHTSADLDSARNAEYQRLSHEIDLLETFPDRLHLIDRVIPDCPGYGTLLHIAACKGYVDLAKRLLDLGASPNAQALLPVPRRKVGLFGHYALVPFLVPDALASVAAAAGEAIFLTSDPAAGVPDALAAVMAGSASPAAGPGTPGALSHSSSSDLKSSGSDLKSSGSGMDSGSDSDGSDLDPDRTIDSTPADDEDPGRTLFNDDDDGAGAAGAPVAGTTAAPAPAPAPSNAAGPGPGAEDAACLAGSPPAPASVGATGDEVILVGDAWTPAHAAAFWNQPDILELLARHGAHLIIENVDEIWPAPQPSFSFDQLLALKEGECPPIYHPPPPPGLTRTALSAFHYASNRADLQKLIREWHHAQRGEAMWASGAGFDDGDLLFDGGLAGGAGAGRGEDALAGGGAPGAAGAAAGHFGVGSSTAWPEGMVSGAEHPGSLFAAPGAGGQSGFGLVAGPGAEHLPHHSQHHAHPFHQDPSSGQAMLYALDHGAGSGGGGGGGGGPSMAHSHLTHSHGPGLASSPLAAGAPGSPRGGSADAHGSGAIASAADRSSHSGLANDTGPPSSHHHHSSPPSAGGGGGGPTSGGPGSGSPWSSSPSLLFLEVTGEAQAAGLPANGGGKGSPSSCAPFSGSFSGSPLFHTILFALRLFGLLVFISCFTIGVCVATLHFVGPCAIPGLSPLAGVHPSECGVLLSTPCQNNLSCQPCAIQSGCTWCSEFEVLETSEMSLTLGRPDDPGSGAELARYNPHQFRTSICLEANEWGKPAKLCFYSRTPPAEGGSSGGSSSAHSASANPIYGGGGGSGSGSAAIIMVDPLAGALSLEQALATQYTGTLYHMCGRCLSYSHGQCNVSTQVLYIGGSLLLATAVLLMAVASIVCLRWHRQRLGLLRSGGGRGDLLQAGGALHKAGSSVSGRRSPSSSSSSGGGGGGGLPHGMASTDGGRASSSLPGAARSHHPAGAFEMDELPPSRPAPGPPSHRPDPAAGVAGGGGPGGGWPSPSPSPSIYAASIQSGSSSQSSSINTMSSGGSSSSVSSTGSHDLLLAKQHFADPGAK
ncbi:hypothetical protein H696_05456 [Fonticula alba]|uniref:Uncharacterized protein n=1 Tax=Fonticula alba TaxID=691883 RepID=A0A058Z182_FONAL|nr:hypothetical protein H696_05456 [Fonticula alba]KCV67990.1 hypothetical protein H696_05456 [Fonticula alba]|eukprot:XP_009497557.1 hypothetical protein H696_05456 [Fonticula alba]